MEYEKMESSALEERKLALAEELEKDDADLDAIEEEVRAINSELETRKNAEQKRKALREQVAKGQGEVVEEFKEERKTMDIKEVRNSKAYIDAFAEYVKSGDDKECRAVLSENASDSLTTTTGAVPVPEFVLDEVKRAWDEHPLLRYVRKTYMAGNLKVGFEVSATDATIHAEGSGEVNEETLVQGIVNIIPQNIKKWISVSDEVLDLRGEAFLRYIYDELAHKIAQKVAEQILTIVSNAPTTSSTSAPAVPVVTQSALSLDVIAKAMAQLSDEASRPIIVMSKATWAGFKALQYNAQYAVDPFEGLEVVFMNKAGDDIYVGDFNYGIIANFPAGEEMKFNFDDKTLATSDLVRIIARQYVGLGLVAPNAIARIHIGE